MPFISGVFSGGQGFVPLGLSSKIPQFPSCLQCACALFPVPAGHESTGTFHFPFHPMCLTPHFFVPLKDLAVAEFLLLAPGLAGAVKPKLDLLEAPPVYGYKGLAIRAPGTSRIN